MSVMRKQAVYMTVVPNRERSVMTQKENAVYAMKEPASLTLTCAMTGRSAPMTSVIPAENVTTRR
jgi:hypothetical protein